MVTFEMSYQDFGFLKQTVDLFEKQLTRIAYTEDSVIFDVPENKINDFILNYRSSYVRKGIENEQTINDTGVRLNQIYASCIDPVLKQMQKMPV